MDELIDFLKQQYRDSMVSNDRKQIAVAEAKVHTALQFRQLLITRIKELIEDDASLVDLLEWLDHDYANQGKSVQLPARHAG